MANSKLLKEAIADAKAVRETAIANAKIALEEAFTPRLQSILSKKLQAEMEGEEEDTMEEEVDSSKIGNGDNVEPSAEASDAHIDLGAESEKESAEVGKEDENLDVVTEEEEMDSEEAIEEGEGSIEDPTNSDDATISEEEDMEMDLDEEMEEEDELDLESIIRELEMGMEDEEEISEEEMDSEEEMHEEDEVSDEEEEAIEDEMDSHEEEFHGEDSEEEMDDEIDLEEILREMGYGDDEEVNEEEEVEDKTAELEAELEEAYATVKSLQSTINEVNLLNAKLLYANRLFRSYNLTNEQKGKVVENLDRTSSVREVKLVYATLAESMNFSGTEKKVKRKIAESVSSKPIASTAPSKEIISESTNLMAERFKQLANIK
jgi:hypothetical protein